jgi:hypothetical protein
MRAVRHRERAAEMVLSSLKDTFVFLPKEMSLRSISSVTPEGEAKPATEP